MKRTVSSVIVFASLVTNGCAYENVKNLTYDALHDRECLKIEGELNCDPDRPSYDSYEKQRKEILIK